MVKKQQNGACFDAQHFEQSIKNPVIYVWMRELMD